jgi:hypothetical protein
VAVNGTFFSLAPGRPTMGTLVTAGILANHVAWRPVGTSFGLGPGNRPSLVPAGQAAWRRHWLELAGGPRLLAGGREALAPAAEGIHDPAVLGPATRTALGYDREGRWLVLASIQAPVSLRQEAAIMRALGAWEALNLDGGTSRGFALGNVIARPGRPLTNVLAFYDARHPAPAALATAFRRFTGVAASPPPLAPGVDPGPFAAGRVTPYKVLSARRGLDFEGWGFAPALGSPAVRNVDGWLDLRKVGPGGVVAPWPRPRRDYTFTCLVAGERGRVVLDARGGAAGWTGLALAWEAGKPARLAWLDRGKATDVRVDARPWSAGRHQLRVVVRGQQARAWVDGREALATRRPAPGPGLGLDGPLMVTRLALGPPT